MAVKTKTETTKTKSMKEGRRTEPLQYYQLPEGSPIKGEEPRRENVPKPKVREKSFPKPKPKAKESVSNKDERKEGPNQRAATKRVSKRVHLPLPKKRIQSKNAFRHKGSTKHERTEQMASSNHVQSSLNAKPLLLTNRYHAASLR